MHKLADAKEAKNHKDKNKVKVNKIHIKHVPTERREKERNIYSSKRFHHVECKLTTNFAEQIVAVLDM